LVFIAILYGIKYALGIFKPQKGGSVEKVVEVIKGGARWAR
jgi:hypothetical protein